MSTKASINRRNFLGLAGKLGTGAAVIASLSFTKGCKGTTEPEPPEPEPPPIPVDLEFKIYNHTKGLIASLYEARVMSGTTFPLSIQDLVSKHNISGVDRSRIVLREENFGRLLQYSAGGSASLTVPRQNTAYDVFLFNSGQNDLYQWLDDLPCTGWSSDFRHSTISFYRQDLNGLTGEERVWGGVPVPEISGSPGIFDQINQALSPAELPSRYGYFERATSGTVSYGFGWSQGSPFWGLGAHVQINPLLAKTIPEQIGIGLGAVFQRTIGWSDWNNFNSDAPARIQANGVLHDAGKDVFAYLFVRSLKIKN